MEVKTVSPGVGSRALVGVSELRDKELSKRASLHVRLPCVVPTVGVVGGLAWPLKAVETRWG